MSGQWRTSGADSNNNNYNYMDEDTLASAGADNVRHRAVEYSRAATGGPR